MFFIGVPAGIGIREFIFLGYVNNFLSNQKDLNPELIVINYFINDVETLSIGTSNWLIKNSQLSIGNKSFSCL